jgi:hypothetical protein
MSCYNKRKQEDIEYGLSEEARLLRRFQAIFGNDTVRSAGTFAGFDYVGSTCCIELKHRRIHSTTYPDIMISKCKITRSLREKRDCYIVYSFLDGLYYIEVTPAAVEKFTVRGGGRCDRGKDERSECFFIPAKMLQRLEPLGDK